MGTKKQSSKFKEFLEIQEKNFDEKVSRPGDEVKLISRRQRFIEMVILLASGTACAMAYPGPNLSFLAWVSLIPLFAISHNKTPGRAWRCGFYWGIAWGFISCFWIREIEPILPLPLAIYMAIYPAFWAYVIPFLHRQIYIPNDIQLKGFQAVNQYKNRGHKRELLFICTLSAWWSILEWIRSWLFTGFPWDNLSATQWQNLSFIQICEYTGIYGVSFIIVFTNLAVYHSFQAWKQGFSTGKYKRSLSFVVAMLMLLINFFIGSQAIINAKKIDNRIPFSATVIQGNVPQSRAATLEQVLYAMSQYEKLTKKALDNVALESMKILQELNNTGRTSTFKELSILKGKPDIVIWPETAVPIPYDLAYPIGQQYRNIITDFIKKYKTPFLIGTLDSKPNSKEIDYNSAFLIDVNNKVIGKYNKKHIVPFGEFVPFAEQLPWLVDMIGMGRGLSRGTSSEPLTIKNNIKAGVNICFEDVFPYITQDQVRAGANLLITITNDAWYPHSDEPEQHLANAIFRAIETRRPYIRCGNNNGSCVIDETGRIIDSVSKRYDAKTDKYFPAPDINEEGFKTFTISIPRNPKLTFYTKHGEIFIHTCLALFFIVISASVLKWRAKKEVLLKAFEHNK